MGNRLRELRTRRGLTQQQLGELVGVRHSQIGRIETGERRLSEHMVYKLAAALDCHPGELFAPLPHETDRTLRMAHELAEKMTSEQRALWFQVGHAMAEQTSQGEEGPEGFTKAS